MEKEKAKGLSLELMEIAEAAYLTSIDSNGFPQTRAMLNLRNKRQYSGLVKLFNAHQDDFLIYFTTNTSSPKINQIKRNPLVSVYYCKPSEWRGLMLSGKIEIVSDEDIKKTIWQKGWEMYYPGGADDLDYAILSLLPISAKYYHQLDSAVINLKGNK